MAELIVRDVEDELLRELELRAARNGQSAEEELHQILRDTLTTAHSTKTLKDLLSEMPNVGDDRDFERIQDRGRSVAL